jgi:hypothetical protein
MREYTTCGLRLDGRSIFVLWFEREFDGVAPIDGVATLDGQFLGFRTRKRAQRYAIDHGLSLVPGELDQAVHRGVQSLESVSLWISDPTRRIASKTLLNAWNTLLDIVYSLDEPDLLIALKATHYCENDIYDKILTGSNIPALMPVMGIERKWHPSWSKDELKELRSTLGSSLDMFRRRLLLIQ